MFVLKCDFHTVQPDKWLSILNLREKKKQKTTSIASVCSTDETFKCE